MVKIRLFRTGTTKRPRYRLVAVDSRAKRQGRVLEFLGTYEPVRGGALNLRLPAVEAWVGKGARLSDTAASLVRRAQREAAAAQTAGASPSA